MADARVDSHEADARELVRNALAASKPGEPPDAWIDRLSEAFTALYFGFAPLGATPDGAARYRLPFPLEVPRFCVQGVDGPYSHSGVDRFAWDFAMPVGTPVVAAREGSVARIRDGYTEAGLDPSFLNRSNTVFVLHADGTFADYSHLRAGVLVKPGQLVHPGDLIGYSGNNGYSAGPHLHFSVYRRTQPGAIESVPIRFGVGSPKGFVPVANQFYGGAPKSNVPLVVTASGQPVDAEQGVKVPKSGRIELAVALAPPGGSLLDVTHAPQTHYLAPTSWAVTVDGRGIVTASPSPDYAAAQASLTRQGQSPPPRRRGAAGGDAPPASPLAVQGAHPASWGVVLVSYEDPAKQRFGFASVPIVILDAAH